MTFSIIYTKEKCAEVYTSANVSRKEKGCIFCVYLFWIMVLFQWSPVESGPIPPDSTRFCRNDWSPTGIGGAQYCDILQQGSGSHKSTSIPKDCNLVNGLHRWWSLTPPTSWSVCSILQLGSWEVRAREYFLIIPHDKLNLIETPKHILLLLIFYCHGDMLKIYFCQLWSCYFFLSHHNNQPLLIHVFLISQSSLPLISPL